MGIWGNDIYDNDAGSAAKALFEVALADGLSPAEAADDVLKELDSMAQDEGLGGVLYIALAGLLLEKNALTPAVATKAKAAIETGSSLKAWEELGEPNLSQRKALLNTLLTRLK